MRLHHVEKGNGPALVLLHAFPNDGALWRPQLEAFGASHRLVAPDLRGFGRSPDTDGAAVAMDAYADDVVAVMDALRIGRAVVGGISLGGYVALSLVLRHPDRVRGLVLANTRAGADNPDWARFREDLVRAVEARGAEAIVESYGDKPFRPDCPQGVKDEVRAMMRRQRKHGLASGIRGMATRPDRTGELARIAVPTLVVSGTADRYIPSAEGEAMHRAIAGSRFVDIPGAGHLSNMDSPGAFNAALGEFLRALPAEPAT
jgi:pimeloyl-ACP methyl ester carboxylesterase